ncbi:MAG: YlbF family regulator [Eubacteriales bacterium]|nr:YlbF family regulator [Eubacteriales bacterium]
MEEIKRSIDALLDAVKNSEEYQKYRMQEELLEQDPELRDRVHQFRANNFRLQNESNREELIQVVERLANESKELRRIPQVNAYLDAELALCKLTQRICEKITEGIQMEIPEF